MEEVFIGQASLRRKSTVLPRYVRRFGDGMRKEKKEKRESPHGLPEAKLVWGQGESGRQGGDRWLASLCEGCEAWLSR